jgi:hypothetical protein
VIYDTDQLESAEHQAAQSVLQGNQTKEQGPMSVTVQNISAVGTNTTGEIPGNNSAAPGPSTYQHLVYQENKHQATSSMFSGAYISQCVFNIHPVVYDQDEQ